MPNKPEKWALDLVKSTPLNELAGLDDDQIVLSHKTAASMFGWLVSLSANYLLHEELSHLYDFLSNQIRKNQKDGFELVITIRVNAIKETEEE